MAGGEMTEDSGRPGIGVDSHGGSVIDPTKNVEALVRALEVTQEKLRTSDARRLDDLRAADNKRQDDLREADGIRLSELASQKDRYDRQIFDIQTVQVKTTSDLISAQLSKETGSLSNQINAATVQTQGLIQTISSRIDKLEQARYETAGRASVQDPATSDALERMAGAIKALTENRSTSTGHTEGVKQSWGFLVGAISAAWAAVATFELLAKHS
jgi:hypothetical protein